MKYKKVNLSGVAHTQNTAITTPAYSHNAARILGEYLRTRETSKSNRRVIHAEAEGQHLGKKYAYRMYGQAFSKETFYSYLAAIRHPYLPCTTLGSPSVAYREEGLEEAMDALVKSCVRVGKNTFSSPLLLSRKWFTVKKIKEITDIILQCDKA